ncbi:MAG: cytochrome c oxidase assembly protein [Pseudolysinimonas sp.]|uniref:cytochrome c oxidase assembly protein n=1 Tax=Pseudolysinimonas sp. TaxID=2680009 RepID=UPI0032674ECB
MLRLIRIAGPAILLLAAFAAVLIGLSLGGGAKPGVFGGDPIVLYGIPIATMIYQFGIATALGALALAIFAFSAREPEFGRALDIAAAGAAVWTVAGAAAAFLTFSSAYQTSLSFDERYGQELGSFLTQLPAGRAWLISVLVGALLTVACFAVRNVTVLGAVTIAAVLGLVPLANDTGHAAGNSSHAAAVTAIWLHTLFAAFWVGGLLTIALTRSKLSPARLAAVMPRYSTIALICFIVVAASGYVSAAIRVGDFPSLLTPYGLLVLIKVGALGALGLFGALQRRAILKRIAAGAAQKWFWLLVGSELAFMGIASGVAAALARTANPVSLALQPTTQTAAEVLTEGTPLPPELTADRWFTSWNLDLLWSLVIGFAIFFYLVGVWRLHRRGDRWPVHRTILWVAGMLALFWVTNGALNVYEQFLFSQHMLEHMLLSMTIPVLLVLSAPITLGLRAIHKRDDGSRGPREWIMVLTHSKAAALLTNPIVAGILFASSLWAFYYTPLFRWATEDHVGHTWMIIHFLAVGYLFAEALVGVDPVAERAPFPLRLILLLAVMAFHAFFGLSLMTGTGLLLADWYGATGRTWGDPPLMDQQNGGGIAWSVGEIPTVALAILVAFLWSRSDERDAKRGDRAAARDGDAELTAYNDMLAEQAALNRRSAGRS